jgi:hypothetical protein
LNKLQGLNNAIFAGTLLALAAGVLKDPTPLTERPPVIWAFVVFFFLLRLKMFMDDQAYFANPDTQNPHFRIGLVFGIASWVVLACADGRSTNLRMLTYCAASP